MTTFNRHDVTLELEIDAPRAKVWKALLDWGKWHPASFGMDPARFHGMVLEPKVGGRLYEDWGDGNGLLWGVITGIDAPKMLRSQASLDPQSGAAGLIYNHWQLEERGKKTLVKFTNTLVGDIGDDHPGMMEQGWRFLFEKRWKAYVEGKTMGEWGAE